MTIAYESYPPAQGSGRGLFWLALATTIATFPLIFLGGLVTTHDAGMSVPDWPNSYGYNMFLYPPSQWVAGVFFEHTHRLLGTLVGFLAVWTFFWAFGVARRPERRRWILLGTLASLGIAGVLSAILWLAHKGTPAEKLRSTLSHVIVVFLCVALFGAAAWTCRRREPRLCVRLLSLAVLCGVITQGALGGLRVVLIELDLAVIHGCAAHLFLCLSALLAIVTSKGWHDASKPAVARLDQSGPPDHAGRSGAGLVVLASVAWVVVFGQLILGATMRHYRAGLSIPDFPTSYGRWLPPMSEKQLSESLDRVPSPQFEEEFEAADDPNDPPISRIPSIEASRLTRVWLAYGHRLGAIAVSVAVVALAIRIFRRHLVRGLVGPAACLLVLLQTQIVLGALVVVGIPIQPSADDRWKLLRKPADITSYHVAVGALILVTIFIVVVRAWRLAYARRKVPVPAIAIPEPASQAQPPDAKVALDTSCT